MLNTKINYMQKKAYFTKALFQYIHRNMEGKPEKFKKGKLVWMVKYRVTFSSVKAF